MTDRIEKTVELKAPVSRVWRALTDYREFGAWFRVRLDGPFEPGRTVLGQITYPGYEHLKWEAVVQKMEPERLLSFTWHPYAIDPNQDYSSEVPTLVEFTLEKIAAGTLLRVVESGFDKLLIFAALGDETRLLVLARLSDGRPQSISRLTEGTNLTRQAVTRHLHVLGNAGVVRNVRSGRENLFELEPQPIEEVRNYLDQVSRQWDDALRRLKAQVED